MKKVLFITYDFPFPTNTGGKNRAYHMLKYGGNHKKYLFSFVRDDFKSSYQKEIEDLGVEIVGTAKRKKLKSLSSLAGIIGSHSIFKSLYYSKEIEDKIMSVVLENNIDIVHFESFYTAFYISEKLRNIHVKQIFGTENIEYTLYEEYLKNANFILKPFYKSQVDKIKSEEKKFYKESDICVAVSENDADHIKKFNDNCFVVRNGVDIKSLRYRAPNAENGVKLLFVGNFSYFPNIDAINYFYDNVFTKLPREFSLKIIGKKVNNLRFANDERIEACDYVDDIEKEYHTSDIMISPLRIGGGTNFKIIEAMACGVPVIALPDRIKSLNLVDGENVIVAVDSQDYIDKIIKTASDLSLRKKIADNGRNFVERKYSWENIGKELARIWEEA